MFLSKLQTELNAAIKANDQIGVSTLRLLLSELHNAKIAKGQELTDQDIVGLIAREAKKRRESIEAFENANRQELVEREKKELAILQKYLPAQLSEEQIGAIVDEVIETTRTKSLQDLGQIMAKVMPKVAGRADGKIVGAIVRGKLSSA